jgi:hypothetical protein
MEGGGVGCRKEVDSFAFFARRGILFFISKLFFAFCVIDKKGGERKNGGKE